MEQQELMAIERGELQAPTPMDLLKLAMSKDADIDKLTRLMELQERWEANEARKDFEKSFAFFQAHPPEVFKNKHVEFGNTKYDHATLDHAVEQIGAGLSAVGITRSWGTEQKDGLIYVSCTLSKGICVNGRTTTLIAQADNSGSKNAIQALGSAVAYLERYTLFAVCGLAAKGQDVDGNGGPHMDDLSERLEFIHNCRNLGELDKVFATHYQEASKAHDKNAMAALIKAKADRRKEMAA